MPAAEATSQSPVELLSKQLDGLGVSASVDALVTVETAQKLLGVRIEGELLKRVIHDQFESLEKAIEYRGRFASEQNATEFAKRHGRLRYPYFLNTRPILDTLQSEYESHNAFHEVDRMRTIVRMLKEAVDVERPENEMLATRHDTNHQALDNKSPGAPLGILGIKGLWVYYVNPKTPGGLTTLRDLREAVEPNYDKEVEQDKMPPFHCTKEAARLLDILDYLDALVQTVGILHSGGRPRDPQRIPSNGLALFENHGDEDVFEHHGDEEVLAEQGPVRWMYYYAMKRVSDDLAVQLVDLDGLSADLRAQIAINPFEALLAIRPDTLDENGRVDADGVYALTRHDMYVPGTPVPASEIMVKSVDDYEGFLQYARSAGTALDPNKKLADLGVLDEIENIVDYTEWREEMLQEYHTLIVASEEADEGGEEEEENPEKLEDLALFDAIDARNNEVALEEHTEGYSTVMRTADADIPNSHEHNSMAPNDLLLGTPTQTLREQGSMHVVDRDDRDVPVLSDQKMASFVDIKLDGADKLAMLVLISVKMEQLVQKRRPDMARDANGNCVNWLAAVEADLEARTWRRSVHIRDDTAATAQLRLQELRAMGVDTQTHEIRGTHGDAFVLAQKAATARANARRLEKDGAEPRLTENATAKAVEAEAEAARAAAKVEHVVCHVFCNMASALEQLTRSRLIVCENKKLLFEAIDAYTLDLVPENRRSTSPYSRGSWSARLANPQNAPFEESNTVPSVIDLRDMLSGYSAPAVTKGRLFSVSSIAPVGAEESNVLNASENLSHFDVESFKDNAETLGVDTSALGEPKAKRSRINIETNGRYSSHVSSSYTRGDVFGKSTEFKGHWQQIDSTKFHLLKCKQLACTDLTQFVRTLHIASWGAPLSDPTGRVVPTQNFLLHSDFDELQARPPADSYEA